MHRSRWLLVLLAGTSAASAPGRVRSFAAPASAARVRAVSNDNRRSAGVLRNGVLTVRFVAQQAACYPKADDGPFKVVEAFGDAGEALRIPAPLMRVRLGTTIDATFANALADTLLVVAIPGRCDTVTIADSIPLTWRAVAKDGFDLPAGQRLSGPARLQIFPGETYDFEFESAAPVIRVRGKNPDVPAGVEDISLELRVRP